MTHPTVDVLEAGLEQVRRSPADRGSVELIVRRPAVDEREIVQQAQLDAAHGLLGDTWLARGSRDGEAEPERQLTVMNVRAAALVAQDPDRRPLAGDQLYVDFDISETNVPAGTRLAIGSAVIEFTEKPHTGCKKFAARFGQEALRFVNSPVGRQLRLRGANARVVVPGTVRAGDSIEKLPG